MLPVTVGFVVPVAVLLHFVLRGYAATDYAAIASVALNSVTVALSVAVMVMSVAGFMVFVATYRASAFLKTLTALCSTGYAFPGTILAIGVVTFAGAVDHAAGTLVGRATGCPLTGSCRGRSGLSCWPAWSASRRSVMARSPPGSAACPPNMMNASRVLGRSFPQSLREVVLPLLRSSFLAGGMLVFVDVMKELPMTLLLRPFNFETLATYVYQFAKDELLEDAALPALFVVLAGIGPVILMNAALRRIGQKKQA